MTVHPPTVSVETNEPFLSPIPSLLKISTSSPWRVIWGIRNHDHLWIRYNRLPRLVSFGLKKKRHTETKVKKYLEKRWCFTCSLMHKYSSRRKYKWNITQFNRSPLLKDPHSLGLVRWWTADFKQVSDTVLCDWCSYNCISTKLVIEPSVAQWRASELGLGG